jgi:hypothetical protein
MQSVAEVEALITQVVVEQLPVDQEVVLARAHYRQVQTQLQDRGLPEETRRQTFLMVPVEVVPVLSAQTTALLRGQVREELALSQQLLEPLPSMLEEVEEAQRTPTQPPVVLGVGEKVRLTQPMIFSQQRVAPTLVEVVVVVEDSAADRPMVVPEAPVL